MLKVQHLSLTLSHQAILQNISFELGAGDWLMIVGPNGAGKTSLMRALSTELPYQGQIQIHGQDIQAMPSRQRAQRVGFLSQQNHTSYDFSVREIVELGRYAYRKNWFGHLTEADHTHVRRAMRATGVDRLSDQMVQTLSGGEVQRTFLAQVFAQNPEILVLDEPTNHLDIHYEQIIFALVRDWLAADQRAVISIVHDLSLAKQYGTHTLLLDQGQIAAYGLTDEVLTAENLAQVYQTDVYAYMQAKYRQWG